MSVVFNQSLLLLACFVGDSEHKKSKRRAPPIPMASTTSPPTVSPQQPSAIVEQISDAASEQQDTQKEQVKQQKQEDKPLQKQEDKQQQKQESKQQDQAAAAALAEDTSSYVVIEKKIEDIIKEFDVTVGTELVEAVRIKLVYKCRLAYYTLLLHTVVISIILSH